MPIFTRRRLQSMLDELSPFLTASKGADILGRLENKRAEQALPAEMELALLWSLLKLGELEIEPEWFGTGTLPDAYSEALFSGEPALIEIACISDAGLSGENDMRRASHRICEEANKIKSRSESHLYFHFAEESRYEHGAYFRRRKVSRHFRMTDESKTELKNWILHGDLRQGAYLRMTSSDIDVVIEWKEMKQHKFNFRSTMPPETYSLTDNPLYTTLQAKADQLKNPASDDIRCILLVDVGSTLLRRLIDFDPLNRIVSGAEIIRNFLAMPRKNIDVVCVLSSYRRHPTSLMSRDISWNVSPFVKPNRTADLEGLNRLALHLPAPRFEGYQARSLHQQTAFAPTARGWYIGTAFRTSLTEMSIRISARALIELLAERITRDQFGSITGLEGEDNVFRRWLEQGNVISSISIDNCGVDEDDDALLIEFKRDPSAASFLSRWSKTMKKKKKRRRLLRG